MTAEDRLPLVLARANARSFKAATKLVVSVLDEAAREGEASVRRVAEGLSQLMPLFNHTSVYRRALPFYQAEVRMLTPLLPLGDPALVRCKQHLAMALGCTDHADEAFTLQRALLEELEKTRAPDDDDRMRTRNAVALGFRTRGDQAASDALYADVPICPHLRPLHDELLRTGAHICDAGQLWGNGSGLWLWFDVVLDAEALLRRLGLDGCVTATENDDPRSGPELGVRCDTHLDGIVGPHPRFNPELRVVR